MLRNGYTLVSVLVVFAAGFATAFGAALIADALRSACLTAAWGWEAPCLPVVEGFFLTVG